MNVTYLVYTMKNILFSALLCLSVLVISCTSEQNNANYTFQIPRSLIKEAKNTPTVPAITKKIADTELICYLVDTCAGKLDGAPVEINMTEIGNPIATANAVFTMQKESVENDQFSVQIPEMVGTTQVQCVIMTDSVWHSFWCFIEPGKTNKIWVDLTQTKDEYNTIYSNNAYNALNYTLNSVPFPYYRDQYNIPKETYLTTDQQTFIDIIMHQHDSIMACIAKDTLSDFVRSYFIERTKFNSYTLIHNYNHVKSYHSKKEVPAEQSITAEQLAKSFSDLQLDPTWLLYLTDPSYYYIRNSAWDFKSYPSEIYSLIQLIKLCAKFEQELWKDAPEDAADFIGDDFCIAAYKHYREQCIQAHSRSKGVYTEETPNVSMDKLLTTIVEKYSRKPLVVDFWGTGCGPCMLDLRQNEAKKDEQTTYVYITCDRWSSTTEWNKTINKVKGHHYYVSDDAFDYMMEQVGHKQGSIPFKVHYDNNGNIVKTVVGYYPSGSEP
jgi:hypothetical protein